MNFYEGLQLNYRTLKDNELLFLVLGIHYREQRRPQKRENSEMKKVFITEWSIINSVERSHKNQSSSILV